jgi:hypothetical protein
MIIKIAEEELKLEKKKLEELLKSAKLHPRKTLLCCTSHKNSMKFYYKDPGENRRIYIRRFEHELLRNITYGAVLRSEERV